MLISKPSTDKRPWNQCKLTSKCHGKSRCHSHYCLCFGEGEAWSQTYLYKAGIKICICKLYTDTEGICLKLRSDNKGFDGTWCAIHRSCRGFNQEPWSSVSLWSLDSLGLFEAKVCPFTLLPSRVWKRHWHWLYVKGVVGCFSYFPRALNQELSGIDLK